MVFWRIFFDFQDKINILQKRENNSWFNDVLFCTVQFVTIFHPKTHNNNFTQNLSLLYLLI